jgi:hypothetical protein
MTWSNAQIKDLLREILGIVKVINERVSELEKEKAVENIETPKPVVTVTESEPDLSKTASENVAINAISIKKSEERAEKRRIFLERMKQGRINAKAKRGLPIL